MRTTRMPFRAPDDDGKAEGDEYRKPDRQAELRDTEADGHAGETEHRAQGEIELTTDHEQRDRDSKNAEFCRNLQEVGDAKRREETGTTSKDAEKGKDENSARKGTELRPPEQPDQGVTETARTRWKNRRGRRREIAGRCRIRRCHSFASPALLP